MNALILFSYSGLHSLGDIEHFYNHLFKNSIPEGALQRSIDGFKSLGTPDPLTTTTNRIGQALQSLLTTHTGEVWKCYICYKHTEPFANQVIARCKKDGVKKVVTLSLIPMYSTTGTHSYERAIVKEINSTFEKPIPVVHIPPIYSDPAFGDILTQRLRSAVQWLPATVRSDAKLIFTAHSMPGLPEAHETFITQYDQLASQLTSSVGHSDYRLAYRSGFPPPQRWLQPDILDVIREEHAQGTKAVVVTELLSLIANGEVIHEIGGDAKNLAHELGMDFVQTEYLNDSYDYVTCLADYVMRHFD